jgi:outer membrane immunogenic protein
MLQSANVLWGIEADIGRSNASAGIRGIPGVASPAVMPYFSYTVTTSTSFDGSLRARVGALYSPTLLLYATGGVAVQRTDIQVGCPGDSGVASWCVADRDERFSKLLTGLTAGVGYEMQLGTNWFTRGEYRYTRFGGVDHVFFAGKPVDAVTVTLEPTSHRLGFGLGYRF